MKVVMSISVNLLFDISKAETTEEKLVAKVLHNNMEIEYADGVECYARYSENLHQDLKKEGIDEVTFFECIDHFQERGWISDQDDLCYFAITQEEGEICKIGDSVCETFRRFDK